jgi:rhamnulokinase
MSHYLAIDLGAESGRAVLGWLSGGRLELEELHRFPNGGVRIQQNLYWDTLHLWKEIQLGLRIAFERQGKLDGIGIDSWGVDFGLLGSDGLLLDFPRHYRDHRTDGVMEKLFQFVSREEVFAQTGIQFLPFNTLFQLYAMKLAGSPALATASRLLNMPDLFNYWLTGNAQSEFTVASTTQFFDPRTMTWATDLLSRLELPCHLLGPAVPPGTLLGSMMDAPHTPVYATAGHDTAAAVAAVPAAEGEAWCYIVSGAWSLMGVELHRPIIDSASLACGCTNEVGAGGRIRLLKNIAGLWLFEECRRSWERQGLVFSYEELTAMAADAPPFSAILDPDAIAASDDIPREILSWCRNTGQEAPAHFAACSRTIFEGVALRYRQVLENLERLTRRRIETIHIVGRGSRNRLLNQFTADCTGRVVIAGPAQAAAAGNILVQAMGAGELSGLEEVREIVHRSLAPERFTPRAAPEWDRAYEQFQRIEADRSRFT